MLKTKRTALTLALGLLLVLFSTACVAVPAQASMSHTASAPPPSRPSKQLPQQLQAGWSGWGEVPGNGFTLSGPAPTFDQVNNYVFVRGTNNHLYVNRTSDGTTWSGWSEVPGHGLTPSAPASTTNGTTVSLFVRGTDNKIYRNTLNGTTWSGWSEVSGHGFTSDTPNAYDNGNGILDLFVRGTDNRIYMNTLNGTTWSGWSEVPGHGLTLSGPTTDVSSAPAGPWTLNLFVRGTDNHLYVNRTSGGTTWSGWSEVPGHGLTPSAPSAATLAFNVGNDTLYLFVRGTDNKIYANTFANGTTWSGWSQVPGNESTPDAPAAMGLTSTSVGFVELFVRGTNDRIYVNYLQVG